MRAVIVVGLVAAPAGRSAPPAATGDVGQRIARECKEEAAAWLTTQTTQTRQREANWTRLCIEYRANAFAQGLL